jgi:hypothetical protein
MEVAFDAPTGQITISGVKSRMSLDEAAKLAADLANAVTANTPEPPATPV